MPSVMFYQNSEEVETETWAIVLRGPEEDFQSGPCLKQGWSILNFMASSDLTSTDKDIVHHFHPTIPAFYLKSVSL